MKDLLSEVFGYDKYAEITSEHAIKGTYCDLAIKLEGKTQILIEVKAIGLDLKEAHTRQAVDYAARQPVNWVFLTNGAVWRIYHVLFGPPVSPELVYECDLLSMSAKSRAQVEHLFLFAKEGQCKSVLDDFDEQRQATDPYLLGTVVLSDAVLDVVRREVRRVFPDVKIDPDKLKQVLAQQVLKREVAEGEKAEDARKRIARAQGRTLRAKSKAAGADAGAETQPAAVVAPPGPLPEG